MMRYSSRFWLYAPTGLFLTLAAIVAVHWWFAAGAFEKKLAAFNHHQAIPGVTVEWTAVTVGGFPFRLDANFTDFALRGAGAHGPFAWTAPNFALHSLSYGRTQDVFEAQGTQTLHWTGADGQVRTLAFLPASFRASAVIGERGLTRFDMDVYDAGASSLTVGRFQFHLRRDPDGRDLDLMLRAESVKGLGADAKLVEVYATLSRADLLTPLLTGAASWPQVNQAWRAGGGAAKLSRITAPGIAPDALLSALY